jgi:integrase/recombinase XerD
MRIMDAVSDYLYAIKHRSDQTQRSSHGALHEFAAWCIDQGIELEALSQATLRRYSDHLHTRAARRGGTLSPGAVHTYLMRVKAFLSWCSREDTLEDIVSEKLARRLELPASEHKVIEVFTPEQYQALYNACAHERYEPTIHRDRAILAVLLDTGVRASELCGLTLEMVFFFEDDSFLRVCGKGKKQREVGIGARCRKLLRVYITRWRKARKAERHVFVNRMGQPMTPSGLNTILDRLEAWSGITGVRVSCHTFRHTFSCLFLLQGGDLYKLSRLLGHTSVRVTERYVQAITAQQARRTSESVLDHLKDL